MPINDAPVVPPLAGRQAADCRRRRLARHDAAGAARPENDAPPAPAVGRSARRAAVAGRRPSPPRRRRHPALTPWAMRHPLPYAFAKAHTLLLEDDGAQLVLWAPETVALPALSEVLRLYDVDALRARAGRARSPTASPPPMPAASRAPRS